MADDINDADSAHADDFELDLISGELNRSASIGSFTEKHADKRLRALEVQNRELLLRYLESRNRELEERMARSEGRLELLERYEQELPEVLERLAGLEEQVQAHNRMAAAAENACAAAAAGREELGRHMRDVERSMLHVAHGLARQQSRMESVAGQLQSRMESIVGQMAETRDRLGRVLNFPLFRLGRWLRRIITRM